MSKTGAFNDFRVDTNDSRPFGLVCQNIFGNSASNLRDLVGMLLPRVENVELAGPHNLCDPRQAVESRAVEDLITISRKAISLIVYDFELAVLSVRK